MTRSRKSLRKIKLLMLLMLVTIIFMITMTYAWFSTQRDIEITGMRINVEVAESMQISLNGEKWVQSIEISDMRQFYGTAGTGHQAVEISNTTTNQNYVPTELLPVSTAGEVADGKLQFVQGTITTNADGTQSLTGITKCSEADFTGTNKNATILTRETAEGAGNEVHPYFVFDMYLRNVSAKTTGIDELFLNQFSNVKINLNAGDQEGLGKNNTGLEYSARVGFVVYENTISITDTGTGIGERTRGLEATGDEVVAIWEPNHLNHTQYVVTNNGRGITELSQEVITYGVKTSAAGGEIANVNSTTDTNLKAVNTFKPMYSANVGTTTRAVLRDVDGNKVGLKPNQISKVRVYVWLEGQDPDCVDLASTGDKINIDLKLVKEENEKEELTYKGESEEPIYFERVYSGDFMGATGEVVFYENNTLVFSVVEDDSATMWVEDLVYSGNTVKPKEGSRVEIGVMEISEDKTEIIWIIDESTQITLTLQEEEDDEEVAGEVKTAATITAEDYGDYVTNYDALVGANVNWRIFHSDGNNIYLIADDYIKNEYKPSGKNGTMYRYTDGEYGADLNALNDYEGTADITSSLATKWLSQYTTKGYTATSTNPNAKVTAYLLDTTVWSGFKDSKGHAEYSIGGPTLELFRDSYNVTHNTALQTQVSTIEGYKVKLATEDDFDYSTYIAVDYNSMYVIPDDSKAWGMWLASPSADDDNDVCNVLSYGYVNCYYYSNDSLGVRPCVCLKSSVQIEKQEDGTYLIVE